MKWIKTYEKFALDLKELIKVLDKDPKEARRLIKDEAFSDFKDYKLDPLLYEFGRHFDYQSSDSFLSKKEDLEEGKDLNIEELLKSELRTYKIDDFLIDEELINLSNEALDDLIYIEGIHEEDNSNYEDSKHKLTILQNELEVIGTSKGKEWDADNMYYRMSEMDHFAGNIPDEWDLNRIRQEEEELLEMDEYSFKPAYEERVLPKLLKKLSESEMSEINSKIEKDGYGCALNFIFLNYGRALGIITVKEKLKSKFKNRSKLLDYIRSKKESIKNKSDKWEKWDNKIRKQLGDEKYNYYKKRYDEAMSDINRARNENSLSQRGLKTVEKDLEEKRDKFLEIINKKAIEWFEKNH